MSIHTAGPLSCFGGPSGQSPRAGVAAIAAAAPSTLRRDIRCESGWVLAGIVASPLGLVLAVWPNPSPGAVQAKSPQPGGHCGLLTNVENPGTDAERTHAAVVPEPAGTDTLVVCS